MKRVPGKAIMKLQKSEENHNIKSMAFVISWFSVAQREIFLWLQGGFVWAHTKKIKTNYPWIHMGFTPVRQWVHYKIYASQGS